jgi:hypothetical protein
MPREATLPPRVVNVPCDYFSMAGFEVTLYGRFWVTPEAKVFAFHHQLQRYNSRSVFSKYIDLASVDRDIAFNRIAEEP